MTRPKKTTVAESSNGRSVRPKTVPDMFSKQKAVASRRRMQESSDEEDELNSSASESESDSDSELGHKKKKKATSTRRKLTASKTILNTSSQLLEQVDESTLNTQNSLYDYAVIPENSMDDIAKEWIKKYKENNKAALKDLINFLIRASGCMMAVTIDAVSQDDGSIDAITELQESLSKLPHSEYPIISKTREHKTLKRNMLSLFQEIIIQCKYDAIYDGILVETLHSWLTTLSSSVYRPFRHTATLVGLKIISALCDVGEKLRDELAVANRQLNAEKNKGTKTNKTKQKTLQQKSSSAQAKCKDVELFLVEFFNNIFTHRMRDVESVIRVECIKELCNWMLSYQAFFVNNDYFRFFGWAFNDQSGTVRSETIKSVIRLYKVESIAQALGGFTTRYAKRIEQMALYDVDVSVRVNAIQLCSTLYKLKIDVLSTNGRTELSNMIASDVPRVRKSAAPFVKAMLYSNVIEPLREEVISSLARAKGGRRSAAATTAAAASVNKNWVFFKGISSYLVEQTNDSAGPDAMQIDLESFSTTVTEKRNTKIANIVEALWEQMPELQEYSSLSDYLCRDHSQTQRQQDDDEMDTGSTIIDSCYRLSEDEETVLISVFGACIRTAITKGLDKNIPEGKDKKKMDDAFWEENKNEISRHLVQVLPKLLSKYSDDATRMSQLVSIPAIMNLSVYSELRAEKEYEELIETLVRVYLGAIQTDLLTNCADSLQHLNKNTSLLEINNVHLGLLKEGVANQVREACSGKDLVAAIYTPALIHSISVSLLRLASLINFTDATEAMDDSQGMSMNVIEYVGALVDRSAFGHKKEKNISLSALTILSRYMMWKCNSLSSNSSSEAVPAIERRRDWTIDKFVEIVTGADVSPLDEVRVAAFGYLVDMYWLFSSDMFDEFGLARLKTQCPTDLQKSLTDYVFEQAEGLENLIKTSDQKNQASKDEINAQKELVSKLFTSYSRGILVRVFEIKYSAALLEQYGSNNIEIDEIIKALVGEFQDDLITGEVAADGICRAYMVSLKKSFDDNVEESGRSIDKTLKLARLEALSLKRANQIDPVRQVPAHIVCERIHLDGITFALSKAAEAYRMNKDQDRDNALKFFKVLAVFGKDLSRARDIAKIHNHLEDCLQRNGLEVEENEKEWEHYISYIKTIDEVLKKKGLRYDATKRANNAETPAAHVFNDVELDDPMADIDLPMNESMKRSLLQAGMDIDDEEVTPKKRRD